MASVIPDVAAQHRVIAIDLKGFGWSSRPEGDYSPAAEAKHSIAGTVFLWLLIVGTAAGGGGFYAYKQGWLLASAPSERPDTAGLPPVTTAQPADTTPHVDSAPAAAAAAATDTTRAHLPPPAPGTPGKLTLQGMPQGARATLNGQAMKGNSMDVPPGVHKLVVKAPGYDQFERQVVITAGQPSSVKIDMQLSGGGAGGAGPCEQYGPAYNQDNLCFDSRPVPLASTLLPTPNDAPVIPREAILLFHVSRAGRPWKCGCSSAPTWKRSTIRPSTSPGLHWNPRRRTASRWTPGFSGPSSRSR
jgi:hypothetical protein